MNTPRLVRGERDKKPPSFFVLLFTLVFLILDLSSYYAPLTSRQVFWTALLSMK